MLQYPTVCLCLAFGKGDVKSLEKATVNGFKPAEKYKHKSGTILKFLNSWKVVHCTVSSELIAKWPFFFLRGSFCKCLNCFLSVRWFELKNNQGIFNGKTLKSKPVSAAKQKAEVHLKSHSGVKSIFLLISFFFPLVKHRVCNFKWV